MLKISLSYYIVLHRIVSHRIVSYILHSAQGKKIQGIHSAMYYQPPLTYHFNVFLSLSFSLVQFKTKWLKVSQWSMPRAS